MKFGCLIGIFLSSAHLICRSTDISKYFRGSLRLRDNESRLYFQRKELGYFASFFNRNESQILKEQICKFFPLRVDPTSKSYLIQRSKHEFIHVNMTLFSKKKKKKKKRHKGGVYHSRAFIRISTVISTSPCAII